MPPRRAKGGSRSQARVSRVLTEEEEEQNRNLQLLLDDIDKCAEAYIKNLEESVDSVCRSIVNMYTMALMKVPPNTKSLTLEDYIEQCQQEGSDPLPLATAMDSVIMEVNEQVSSVKSAVQSSTRKRAAKATSKSTVKRQPARGGRSGSREEATAAQLDLSASRTVQFTPALRQPPGGQPLGATPFITPKFKMGTPACRTLTRVARPSETLVSLSGSPVNPLVPRSKIARAEAENVAPIPLGSGQTINIPMALVSEEEAYGEGLDLDEEQLLRLSALSQNLNNMLKMRSAQLAEM